MFQSKTNREREKKMLYAFGYQRRVGKDEAAKYLCQKHGFKRIAFADLLRMLLFSIHPHLTQNQLSEKEKDQMDARLQTTPRGLMLRLGDGLRKCLGEDIFVRFLQRQLQKNQETRVVVTDVRYPKEFAFLKSQGARMVKIERNKNGVSQNFSNHHQRHNHNHPHPSETLLSSFAWDKVVVNNGTLPELHTKLESLLKN